MENQTVQEVAVEAINVKIVGHELISKKLFDVVMHLLLANEVQSYGDCIRIIRFNVNEPDSYGGFDYESKEVNINLKKHFDFASNLIIEDEALSRLSLRAHIWFGLLTTVVHEILHAVSFAIDPDTVINFTREELEDNIKEETARQLSILIRDYDTEPPLMDDDPFFSPLYMEFYIKKIKDNAEQWAINQNELHRTSLIWKHNEATEASFRKWYRISYDFADESEWDKDPAPLLAAEVEDEVILVVNDPIITPEVINLPAAPIDQTVLTPSVEIVETLTMELDPESLAALYNAEEPIDIPEGDYSVETIHTEMPTPAPTTVVVQPTVAPTPAPAPVQQPLPITTALPPKQEITTVCKSCSTTLSANVKFCSNCGTSTVETPKPVIEPTPQAVNQPAMTYPQHAPQAQMPNNLPNYNLTAEQIRACVGDIIVRCYQHIYSKCGFRPGQNPQFAPEHRQAIAEPVSVLGIPCIDKILIAMDAIDAMTGRYQKQVPVVNGMIRGKTTKNMGLPSYTLYLNFNGHMVKRLILPQNQWKDNGQGGYSQPAIRAQQGAMILWMMDGDDSVPGQKWKAKIENGALEWLV